MLVKVNQITFWMACQKWKNIITQKVTLRLNMFQ